MGRIGFFPAERRRGDESAQKLGEGGHTLNAVLVGAKLSGYGEVAINLPVRARLLAPEKEHFAPVGPYWLTGLKGMGLNLGGRIGFQLRNEPAFCKAAVFQRQLIFMFNARLS